MALFRKFFFKKPPEGLLEVSERIFGMHFFFRFVLLDSTGNLILHYIKWPSISIWNFGILIVAGKMIFLWIVQYLLNASNCLRIAAACCIVCFNSFIN